MLHVDHVVLHTVFMELLLHILYQLMSVRDIGQILLSVREPILIIDQSIYLSILLV